MIDNPEDRKFSRRQVLIGGGAALGALGAAGIVTAGRPAAAAQSTRLTTGTKSYVGLTVGASTYAGEDVAEAIVTADKYLSRPMAAQIEKTFYGTEGQFPSTPAPGDQAIIKAGGKVLIAVKPGRVASGMYTDGAVTVVGDTCLAEKNALATLLASYRADSVAGVIMWSEVNYGGNNFDYGGANYVALVKYYGPVVKRMGIPLVYDASAHGSQYWNAFFPPNVDWVMVDFYYDSYSPGGPNLHAIEKLANDNGKAFGIAETGVGPKHIDPGLFGPYATYIHDLMVTRLTAGRTNAPLLAFGVGLENIQNVVTSATDFKVPYYQRWYDDLSANASG